MSGLAMCALAYSIYFMCFTTGMLGDAWEVQDLTRTLLDFSTGCRIDKNHLPRYSQTSNSPFLHPFLIREEKIGSISYTLSTFPDGVQHRRSVSLQISLFNWGFFALRFFSSAHTLNLYTDGRDQIWIRGVTHLRMLWGNDTGRNRRHLGS